MHDEDIETAVQTLATALLERGWSVACAESCTGGWIAKAMTDQAGSSAWFDRGWVTYSNAAKTSELGVADTILQGEGAVSAATVRAMAAGALRHSLAEIAVAVSGIAGPSGGSPDKPVGTVWLGYAHRTVGEIETSAERYRFAGPRDAVRRQAVLAAVRGGIALVQRLR